MARILLMIFTLGLAVMVASGCPQPEAVQPLAAAGALPKLVLKVRATQARAGALAITTVRTGFLEPVTATKIAPEVAGTIALRGFSDGQVVKAGEVLFRLEAGRQRLALDGARAAISAAKVEVSFLEQELGRTQKLVERKAAATRQLDAARLNLDRAQANLEQAEVAERKAQRALRDTTLRAPHDGVVHGRQADVGDQVAPGRPLLELVDLSRVRLRVGVGGASASRLRQGTTGTLLVDDLGGLALSAQLVAVAPRSDPRTGLFEVIYEAAPPPDAGVRGGMVARVRVDEGASSVVLVPRAALLLERGAPALFIADGGRASKRTVRTGRSDDTSIEVSSGLRAGEWVIITGLHALAEGAPVEVEAAKLQAVAPAAELR